MAIVRAQNGHTHMNYSKSFLTVMDFVLKAEGGLVDNPHDPGGLTNFGISQRSYPNEDIRNLTKDRALAIYFGDYWWPSRCDLLPLPVAFVVMDSAVNCGVRKAIVWLQTEAGAIPDGVFGPKTLDAVEAMAPENLARDILRVRQAFYLSLRTYGTFGKGWMNRMASLSDALDEGGNVA